MVDVLQPLGHLSLARAEDKPAKKACCDATTVAEKSCEHKCCQKAAEAGKICKKCHPDAKKDDKKKGEHTDHEERRDAAARGAWSLMGVEAPIAKVATVAKSIGARVMVVSAGGKTIC